MLAAHPGTAFLALVQLTLTGRCDFEALLYQVTVAAIPAAVFAFPKNGKIRMIVDPRQQLVVDLDEQRHVFGVIAFHLRPRLRVAVHARFPKFEAAGLYLAAEVQHFAEGVQAVRCERKVAFCHLERINGAER